MSKLDPSVQEFKDFVNDHPKLRREIRKNGRSWQEYYEKWALLGEEDSYWNEFITSESTKQVDQQSKEKDDKEENKQDNNEGGNAELINQLVKYASKIDIEKMQGQVDQFSKAIGSVQELVDQFKNTGSNDRPKDPFHWIKD